MPDLGLPWQASEPEPCDPFAFRPRLRLLHTPNDVTPIYAARVVVLLRFIGILTTHGVRCAQGHHPSGDARRADFSQQRDRGDGSRRLCARNLERARWPADSCRNRDVRFESRERCIFEQRSKRIHVAYCGIYYSTTFSTGGSQHADRTARRSRFIEPVHFRCKPVQENGHDPNECITRHARIADLWDLIGWLAGWGTTL